MMLIINNLLKQTSSKNLFVLSEKKDTILIWCIMEIQQTWIGMPSYCSIYPIFNLEQTQKYYNHANFDLHRNIIPRTKQRETQLYLLKLLK